ncbi:MAG: NAD(P)/FAD-dependent oxidoreductase [Acidimicrobiales bacterium]
MSVDAPVDAPVDGPVDGPVDVLVVGGGPAGALAAAALVQAGREVAIVDPLGVGGRLLNVEHLHHRDGQSRGMLGWDRASELAEQVLGVGVELIFGQADTVTFDPADSTWRVSVDGQPQRARAVLVATGCRPEPVPGDEQGQLHGHGVSYCAVCDAGLFRGQPVAVIGGGPIAMAEAASLVPMASEVIVLVPTDHPTAPPTLVDALRRTGKVTWRMAAPVLSVGTTGAAGSPTLTVRHTALDGQTITSLHVGGVFGAHRDLPNSALLHGVAALDDDGFVITDDTLGCVGVPGLFAAGDVRAGGHADLAAAEADGKQAAASIDAYLRSAPRRSG